MIAITNERIKVEIEAEFVVFLIGMRINKWWKIHQWLPIVLSMPKMLDELYDHPEMGFISQENWSGRTTLMVQYWESLAHLEAYAKNDDAQHFPQWRRFNQRVARSGDVGIWHEIYHINKGHHKSTYINMPNFGLAKAERILLSRRL